jgi:Phospholipase/Carboxylesterase
MPPGAGGAPRQLIILLHGVGADGNDLIALAPVLAERLPNAAFVAPDAPEPCDLAPFGCQWFSLRDRRPAALLLGVAPKRHRPIAGVLGFSGLCSAASAWPRRRRAGRPCTWSMAMPTRWSR